MINIKEKEQKIYNPQMTEGKPYKIKEVKIKEGKILNSNYTLTKRSELTNTGTRYPTSMKIKQYIQHKNPLTFLFILLKHILMKIISF
jgi:hypothetical protein